jgi:hypothetical protein
MSEPRKTSVIGRIFEGQALHAILLAILLAVCLWLSRFDAVGAGALWGLNARGWFWIALAIPVVHQLTVWFVWRTELHAGLMTRWLGAPAFSVYAVGFAVLGLARVASVFVLAAANAGTAGLDPTIGRVLAVIALLPALYLFYSVRRYFGFRRAFGIDHFDPAAARSLPFERRGIFRWTPNAMYVFGFLIGWVPALWWGSAAAFAAAAFNHLYIWVHYYATERPDMRRIYGGDSDG